MNCTLLSTRSSRTTAFTRWNFPGNIFLKKGLYFRWKQSVMVICACPDFLIAMVILTHFYISQFGVEIWVRKIRNWLACTPHNRHKLKLLPIKKGLIFPGTEHVRDIAEMSLDFMSAVRAYRVPHLPAERVNLRIGMNTGQYFHFLVLVSLRVRSSCWALVIDTKK